MHLPILPTALLLLLQSTQCVVQARCARIKGQPCDPGYPENDPIDVRSELLKHGVIPDVVKDFYPSIALEIAYESGAKVRYGNWLDGDLVKKRPKVTFHPIGDILDPRVHYYLALTDPDAPARTDPEWSEVCHWLLTNITQTCHCDCDKDSGPQLTVIGPGIDITGDDLVTYYQPNPPEKTGPHRYVFVLLRPKDPASNPKIPKPAGRRHWGDPKKGHYGVQQYAEDNNLVPVGGNVFYVENRKGAPTVVEL